MPRRSLLLVTLLALTACVVPPRNTTRSNTRSPNTQAGTPAGTKPIPKPPVPVSSEFSRNRDFENIPARHVKTFSIRCGNGSLKLEGTSDPNLNITTWIYAWAESAAESERINREIEVSLLSAETENPSLVISEPTLGRAGRRYEVNVTVKVPAGVAVSIIDGGGSIEVWNLDRGVKIQNEEGPVEIHEVGGGVDLVNRGGPVKITGASGRILVKDARSDLHLSQIEGEIDVTDPGGKLSIHHATGTVIARGNPEGIDLLNVEGEAILYGIPADRSSLKGVANLSFKDAE